MAIILGPEPSEVRHQVCPIHYHVTPCSEKPKVQAVDTDGPQANTTGCIN